ncbi:MAG: HEAT repeat domain-containing protein [Planctomycetota bacterium]|jgi:HEAT repeat protein|nr:HEAT repeat domain-containing protein [Planctomycetota bacterium]
MNSLKSIAVVSAVVCIFGVIGCGKGKPPTRGQKATKLMNSGNKKEQIEGIKMVGNLGKEGQYAVPDIMKLLESSDAELRSAAVQALTSLEAEKAGDKFEEMAQAEADGAVLYELLNGIKTLKGAEAMIAACKPLLSGDGKSKLEATNALSFLTTGDPIPVADLAALVEDSDAGVRANVATALGKTDPESGDAAAAKAALKKLSGDKDPAVQSNAQEALQSLGDTGTAPAP